MTLMKTTLKSLLLVASGTTLGCAEPCIDDGLLQKEGNDEKCAALASAGGTGGTTTDSASATESASADAGDGCNNGVMDGDETDVDCGGSCDTKCGSGQGCGGDADCQSGSCDTGAMTCDPGDGTCEDGTQNQDETDVDCGGVCGSTCEVGEGCNIDEDCVTDFCGEGNACEPNPLWCNDADGDGSGDPDDCVMVDDGDDPPDGWVNNDNDCDDTSEFVFPGAAPNDSPTDCMEDKDEDDWADDTPAGPATIAGTDCDDDSENGGNTFPGAAPNDSETACMNDDDGDDWGDNDVPPGVEPGGDCDDTDVDKPPSCLTVAVSANPININAGEGSDLLAEPMDGDGNYTFAWTPAGSIDDATIADPGATPGTSTTYAVTVTDGNADMATGDVTVHVVDTPVQLDECEEVDFGIDLENNPDAVWEYNNGGEEACETANGDPTALVCNVKLDDAKFTARFGVQDDGDNDHIGFVWGYQDAQHFYLLTWKQEGQEFTDCGVDVPTGVVIKVIEADGALACEDLLDDTDTPNSTVLALPDAFHEEGWEDDRDYIFELEHTPMGFTVRISYENNGNVVAEGSFVDATYTSGRFGVYTYSQSASCFSDVFTEGL